jgi:hypothetical protein
VAVDAEVRAPVDPGGILQFAGQGTEELPHHEDAEGQPARHLGQDDAEQIIQQSQASHRVEERDQDRVRGNGQPDQERVEEPAVPWEFEPGEAESRQG